MTFRNLAPTERDGEKKPRTSPSTASELFRNLLRLQSSYVEKIMVFALIPDSWSGCLPKATPDMQRERSVRQQVRDGMVTSLT